MPYRHGRCIGRLIHCLDVCKIGHYGLPERAIFDGNLVRDGHNGPVFASFQWEGETDTPHFLFYPENYPESDRRSFKDYERKQYYMKPYIDDPEMLQSISYIVQEVKKILPLSDALQIREIRDRKIGEWQELTNQLIYNVKNVILNCTHRHVSNRVDSLWRHVLLSSIFDFAKTPDMHLPWLHESKRVVNQITLREAEQIIFVRDQWDGDWTKPVGLEDLIAKLKSSDIENWQTLAMGAVSNIQMR